MLHQLVHVQIEVHQEVSHCHQKHFVFCPILLKCLTRKFLLLQYFTTVKRVILMVLKFGD